MCEKFVSLYLNCQCEIYLKIYNKIDLFYIKFLTVSIVNSQHVGESYSTCFVIVIFSYK